MDDLKNLVDFVEGALSLEDFEQLLYSSSHLEEAMNSIELHGTTSGEGLYLYIVSKNFKNVDDVYDAHQALCAYLDSLGQAYQPTTIYFDILEAVAGVQPKWLLIPSVYVFGMFSEFQSSNESGNFKKWLKSEIKKRFVCQNKPPKWLQDTIWPMEDGVPLRFVGQYKKEGLHDDSYVYEFLNETTGVKKLIVQSA